MPSSIHRVAAVLLGSATFLYATSATLAQTADIGVIDSLTGTTAITGTSNVCGIRVALDAIKDAGILGSQSLRVVVEDDQSKPAVAAQAAAKLTGQGIRLFAGGAVTATVLSALPILKDAGALHTGGTAKAEQIFQTGAYVVRINSDNSQDGATIANYVSKTLGAKRIAFVALQGAYGEGAPASIRASLAPGSEIVNPIFAPVETTNFQSIITSIAAEKPDAVIWALFGNTQTVALLRQYKQAGLKMPLIGAAGTLSASLVKTSGGSAEGVVSADLWVPDLENSANQLMKDSYAKHRSKYAECSGKTDVIDRQIALSYSQVLLLAKAMAKAGSTNPKVLRDTTVANEWELPQGKVKFLPNGQATSEYYIIVAKGDDISHLKP